MPFTSPSAWEFVANCLDGGCPLQEVELDKPKGKVGYVMVVDLSAGSRLYVKLQLGDG